MSKKIGLPLIVTSVLLLAFSMLMVDIKKPFWGHHDWNSVVYGNIAKNYVKYGYLKTNFGQVTNIDKQESGQFSYYHHYPPLFTIIISVFIHIFGQSEAPIRSSIILFSIILIFYIYKIGALIHSPLMGIFAAITLTLTPIFLYFGKLPTHDPVVVSISTVAFYYYLKFIRSNQNKYYAILLGCLFIGGLINWSAFYVAPVLALHQVISKTN